MKIGDKVRFLLDGVDFGVSKGTIGTISKVISSNSYAVEFPGAETETILFGDTIELVEEFKAEGKEISQKSEVKSQK